MVLFNPPRPEAPPAPPLPAPLPCSSLFPCQPAIDPPCPAVAASLPCFLSACSVFSCSLCAVRLSSCSFFPACLPAHLSCSGSLGVDYSCKAAAFRALWPSAAEAGGVALNLTGWSFAHITRSCDNEAPLAETSAVKPTVHRLSRPSVSLLASLPRPNPCAFTHYGPLNETSHPLPLKACEPCWSHWRWCCSKHRHVLRCSWLHVRKQYMTN